MMKKFLLLALAWSLALASPAFPQAQNKSAGSSYQTGETGTMVWGVRNDAGTALTGDLTHSPITLNSSGALRTSSSVDTADRGTGVRVSFNRTADTNAYTAGDVIGSATGSTAALTFSGLASGAREIFITSVSLEIDLASVPSGMGSFSLECYNVTPPSAYGDNAAWDLGSGDRTAHIGTITIGTPIDKGSTLKVRADAINAQITTAGTAIYCYLVTAGAYTPASGTTYVVTVHAVPF